MLTFFGYTKCSTCRQAKKTLTNGGLSPKEIDITMTPPSQKILGLALAQGYSLKDLLNTSGQQYRELGLKERLQSLSQKEVLALLTQNGRLVKRPIVTDGSSITVGFREPVFSKTWGVRPI